ncbi:phage virion morphogenesis protein [Asticcacaulis sp. BYS171W]|uniref:Phage virion morphogenesis protein n=1 Tax=Asticcacaulis aquaticus TaxID=2984212 RepID=A0ABT5HT78_9CAUL|nr:phage virion morphogenesis protein [Asticcacaulis aquaticus]MDC7683278.1 phage virion morphogenesis protein [Asticcacaulis aquaticus]
MARELAAIEDMEGIVNGLLVGLSPSGRAVLMRKVARDWRKSQSARIRAQKNPDGSTYEKRKPLKDGYEPLKNGAMFRKLRLVKYLKSGASANEAWVGFVGRVAAIARVHQYGLKDRVVRLKGAPEVQYPERVLLGLADDEREDLLDLVMSHLDAKSG